MRPPSSTSMTVGPPSPGVISRTRESASRGTFAMRYRCPRARSTEVSAVTRSSRAAACDAGHVRGPGGATSQAEDSRMVATSRSPLTLSVDPVDVRSTMTSAMPRCGATSAAPAIGTISTVRPRCLEKSAREAREAGRHAGWAVTRRCGQVVECHDSRLFAGRDDEPAVPELEVDQDDRALGRFLR